MLSHKLTVWGVLLILILGVLACSAPTGPIAETDPASTSTVPASPTHTPTPGAGTAQPTAAPTGGGDSPGGDQPHFSNLRFTTDPDSNTDVRTFPEGTEEVWAVWDYANMIDGLVVRRLWTLDGETWVEREEPWDFARYGANGTMRDISIFDRDIGLEAGTYRLQLSITGVGQTLIEPATFTVTGGGASGDGAAYPSPDLAYTALIQPPGTLLLNHISGTSKTLAQGGTEIIDVEWLPDNLHLIYVTLDRGDAPDGPTIGWQWDMWMVDIQTGDKWQLNQGDEQLHDPAASPNGSIIAVVSGSGYGDAGFVDTQLGFMYLDVFFKRNDLIFIQAFQGIPANTEGTIYPVAAGTVALPGEWVELAEFHAILNSTFAAGSFQPGVYAFHTFERIAERIGELPPGVQP